MSDGTQGFPTWFAKLLLSVTSVLVGQLLIEGWFRLNIPEPGAVEALEGIDAQMELGHWRAWHVKPNLSVGHNGVQVRTNSFGCRDREFSVRPVTSNRGGMEMYRSHATRAGKTRVLLTGDSFVYGDGTPQEDVLSAQLGRGLGSSFEVFGCGQLGYNTLDAYMFYKLRLRRLKPAVVVHIHVLYDTECRQFCPEDSLPESIERLRSDRIPVPRFLTTRLYAAEFISRRIAMRENCRFHLESMLFRYTNESPGWRQSTQYLLKFADLVEKDGGRFHVALFPLMTDFEKYPFEKAHEAMIRFCEANGLSCVDFLSAFREYGKSGLDMHVHMADSHPNGEAYGVAARRLRRMLADRP